MASISVIGLGIMGSALVRTLMEQGYEVTVWNRTSDKAAPHIKAGARLAESAADAVRASPSTITCVRSHGDTRAVLEADPGALSGKTLIELSTGDAAEAGSLMRWVREQGADCLIGMISTFPGGIGQPESAILAAGPENVWKDCEPVLKTLAGKSACIGREPRALAAIYASLFLPRQGFMFGMIYGALICERAGVSMSTYVEQLPLTLKVVQDYYEVFASSVPSADFSNPPASMGTYHAAFQDVLNTCQDLGVTRELPQLLHDLVARGIEAGLAEQQITSLVKVLQGSPGQVG